MCLGIPGRIVGIVDTEHHIATADVSGVKRKVSIGLLTPGGVQVGDWVLIHVGFAISRIDEEEARRTQEFLEDLGQPYRDEMQQFQESRID